MISNELMTIMYLNYMLFYLILKIYNAQGTDPGRECNKGIII